MLLVLGALIVSYAQSLRVWFDQHQQVTALQQEIRDREKRVDELNDETHRWDDDAFVKAQARQRLGWVMPGEVGYRVIGADGKPLGAPPEPRLDDGPTDHRSRPGTRSCGGVSRERATRRPRRRRRLRPNRPRSRSSRRHRRRPGERRVPRRQKRSASSSGRTAAGIRSIAHRCTCGLPDVVETEPRLPDGTPFPTTYYVTCPRLASAIGTLEAEGMMKEMTDRLGSRLRTWPRAIGAAHESYLAHRESVRHVEEIAGITAGGMPDRVKCLHVLVGHSLAAGPGVNPLGDEGSARSCLGAWGRRGVRCALNGSRPSTAGRTRSGC